VTRIGPDQDDAIRPDRLDGPSIQLLALGDPLDARRLATLDQRKIPA
jgi:hypothetical protein